MFQRVRAVCALAAIALLLTAAYADAAGVKRRGVGNDREALATTDGPVAVYPVEHASLVLRWHGQSIYVDPTGSAKRYRAWGKSTVGKPTVILITHAHGDHLSETTLAELDTRKAVVVMPPSVAKVLGDRFGSSHIVLSNGESRQVGDMKIEAVPAYNIPPTPDARHPEGWGNGYVLTLGGKRIYISGDTGPTPEMRALKDIDLAFVCMNLPYTMSAEQAADAVLDFKPAVVYPYHYRGQDVRAFKALVDANDPKIQVRLRNWYPSH